MISIKQNITASSSSFVLKVDENILSECFFDPLKAEITDIVEYNKSDEDLKKALIKAVLSHLEYKGYKNVFTKINYYTALLTSLGFEKNEINGFYELNLEGYFDKPCEGCSK